MANQIQSCFRRYEKKYCLTAAQQRFLLEGMAPYKKKDAYGAYTICNIYYDTGDFSLVRFRSAPGTAREIGVLFLGMAIGLATGMGYVGLAALTFVIVSAALVLLTAVQLGGKAVGERILKITIPENLDYEGLFDDLFARYTTAHTLVKVKTSNMGTLYELEYRVTLPEDRIPKEFLDALRCRNGNLNIVCGRELTRDAL